MEIITFLNEKGGVGKTTLSGTLAVGLAAKGLRVLAIDADGQGNLSSWFQLPKKGRFYDLCRRDGDDAPWSTLVMVPPADVTGDISGSVAVVVGNEESNGITSGVRINDLVVHFKKRLAQIDRLFDFCIIDTQPSPTILHDVISLVTDYLIFPTQPEAFSAWEGLADSIRHTQENREQAMRAGMDVSNILAIVPNQYRGTAQHQHFVKDLIRDYKELVIDPIPLYTAISEQQLMKAFLITDMSAPEKSRMVLQTFVDTIAQRLGIAI